MPARVPRILLACVLSIQTGCGPAVHRDGDRLEGIVAFEVEPGWRVVRNTRWLEGAHLILDGPEAGTSLAVDLVHVGRKGQDLPLDLVAEGIVGNLGRSQGVETFARTHQEVDLAGRPAVALTGFRRHGPRSVDFSALVARDDRHLVIVFLQAPPGRLGTGVAAMERLLSTFDLPGRPVPLVILEE
ncbi:MAG: hypothetical protein JXB39_03665 [Deltaproteobacteria bacterium]|nr:hypothetical protein [Deltaproteobacteria bacterium]